MEVQGNAGGGNSAYGGADAGANRADGDGARGHRHSRPAELHRSNIAGRHIVGPGEECGVLDLLLGEVMAQGGQDVAALQAAVLLCLHSGKGPSQHGDSSILAQ